LETRLEFRGTAREYFGIWIVNTLLKIVTLGIYSAWAKVRRRKYFSGATLLGGEPFEYLANPMALFRGWMIAVAAFLLYMVAGRFSPLLAGLIGIAIFAAMPWIVVRSRIFNCRNLAYRNIRLDFRPDYPEAYKVFLGISILVPLTLGLLFPYAIYRQKKFLAENCSFGATPFRFTATPGDFYRLFGRIALVLLGVAVLMFAAVAGSVFLSGGVRPSRTLLSLLPLAMTFVIYLTVGVYAMTGIANLTWNATQLGNARFASTMQPASMIWLAVSGAFATACSLGLLFPWAAVRFARYRAERLSVEAADGLDSFVAGVQSAAGDATGEEIGDLFGIDWDFAL
jgi:uncharacterized membrane protein YjgN (DUF898 family)